MHVITATKWIDVIRRQCLEVPSITLTPAKVQRLWDLDEAPVGRVRR